MPLRIERARAQDSAGEWIERDIKIAQRFRVRIVSDRTLARSHQFGHGEEFEIVVDTDLDIWVRRLGSREPFRKEDHAFGVALYIGDNITSGIVHTIRLIRKNPSRDAEIVADPDGNEDSGVRYRWECTCNAAGKEWIVEQTAELDGAAHVREAEAAELAMIEQDAEIRRERIRKIEQKAISAEIGRRRDELAKNDTQTMAEAQAIAAEQTHAEQIPLFTDNQLEKPEGLH